MTKPREKTREELTAEIEDGKKKIRQLENWEKVLRQKLSIVNNSTHFDISKSTLAALWDNVSRKRACFSWTASRACVLCQNIAWICC